MTRSTSLAVLAFAVTCAGPAAAQTVLTLAPTQDTYVDSMVPDVNFGSDVELMVGRGTPLGLGNARAYLEFDIPPLPHANLRSATLRLYRFADISSPSGAVLNRCTSAWDATTVTWDQQPTFSSTVEATEVGTSSFVNGWKTWDVLDLVLDIDAGTVVNLGWVLKDRTETSGTYGIGMYHSTETTTDPEREPQLRIEFYDLLLQMPSLSPGVNTVRVEGAAPGAHVTLALSLEGFGSTPLPTGEPTELQSPEVVATATAGASGVAVIDLALDPSHAGQTWFVQALTAGAWSNPTQGLVTPLPCEGELHAGGADNRFGHGLALTEQHLVVGAPWETVPGPAFAGRVYVYRRDDAGTPGLARDDGWILQDELPSPSATFTNFGSAVAVDGDMLVIGAPGRLWPSIDDGAAYVHVRDDAGTADPADDTWPLADVLVPPLIAGGMRFGYATAVRGDDVLVGAPFAAQQVGRAYLFRRDDAGTVDPTDDTWPLLLELDPRDLVLKRFGWSVDLDDDRLFVGAPRQKGAIGKNEGAVFVFRRPEGSPGTLPWPITAVLTDPFPGAERRFGHALAADGGHLFVGSPPTGRAYVFRLADDPFDPFALESVLEDPFGYQEFSDSVALSGGHAVVGSRYNPAGGSAWVYRHEDQGTPDPADDVWRLQQRLAAGVGIPTFMTQFGNRVGVAGDLVVVGEDGDDSVTGFHRDAASEPLDAVWSRDACLGEDGTPAGR